MGYRIRALDPEPILGIEFFDAVTGATIVEALRSVTMQIDTAGAAQAGHLLWDTRAVTSLVVGPEDLPPIAEAIDAMQRRIPQGRSAAVFRQGQFDPYIFTRLLMTRASAVDARERALFTDVDEACAWLTQGTAGTG